MKISVLQQDLLPYLQSASRSIGARATLPVLDNILLSAQGSKLKIAATNLEVGVIKNLPVEVLQEGEVTVPAKTLVEVVSGLGPVKVELESDGELLVVQSGKFKATINGISAAEFPVIPLAEGDGVELKKEDLLSSSRILFASAVDEGRPVLTGVLTEIGSKGLSFVATDGFRLAHRQAELKKTGVSFQCLIPRRTFEEVIRLISEEGIGKEEVVGLATSKDKNQIVFTIGETLISSRLIEGRFPAWEKIIPTEIKARVVLEKDQLLKALKLAAIFAKNEANIVVLNLGENKVEIKSQAKQLGSQENEVEGQVEGEKLEIAFNAKFIQEAISAAPSVQVMIEFSGPLSACLIKPVGISGLEYIVMPVRLS